MFWGFKEKKKTTLYDGIVGVRGTAGQRGDKQIMVKEKLMCFICVHAVFLFALKKKNSVCVVTRTRHFPLLFATNDISFILVMWLLNHINAFTST